METSTQSDNMTYIHDVQLGSVAYKARITKNISETIKNKKIKTIEETNKILKGQCEQTESADVVHLCVKSEAVNK